MGAVKETMMLYCETVHPDDWDKQDELFTQIMETGKPSLEEMVQAIKDFQASGQVPSQPALTLRRACAALGVDTVEGGGKDVVPPVKNQRVEYVIVPAAEDDKEKYKKAPHNLNLSGQPRRPGPPVIPKKGKK